MSLALVRKLPPCLAGVAAAFGKRISEMDDESPLRRRSSTKSITLLGNVTVDTPSESSRKDVRVAGVKTMPTPARNRGNLAPKSPKTPSLWEEAVSGEVVQACRSVSADRHALVSALDLIAAVRRDPALAALLLPASVVSDSKAFARHAADAADAAFEEIAEGRLRIRMSELAEHLECRQQLRLLEQQQRGSGAEIRRIFSLIDRARSGTISKLKLFEAVRDKPNVAAFLLPDSETWDEEQLFDDCKQLFRAIAGGKKRIEFHDFEHHLSRCALDPLPPCSTVDRTCARVLVIEAGFGRSPDSQRAALLEGAGYQLRWSNAEPQPAGSASGLQLESLRADIEDFLPDAVVAASVGGAYVAALWSAGIWRGPTVLINAHSSCRKLPSGVPVVLAHGARDEVFRVARAQLEETLASGTRNECFLYHTAGAGADDHGMRSLQARDCLPRLVDAAMCPDGPEVHMLRSWRARLTEARQEAENLLGYTPERLRRRWVSPGGKGLDDRKLFAVQVGSDEFQQVETVFKASPGEPAANFSGSQEAWDRIKIVAVHRVENGAPFESSTKPHYDSVRKSVEDQGVDFEPGTHTCWAFHGADADTIESVINDPIAGFKPLSAPGPGGAAPWGSGVYFSRDARHLAMGNVCGAPAMDGTRCMLMCLLSTGMPCLGDPQQRGVLPMRCSPHRYHSAVDSFSSPEVFVTQHAGAAHAAYLITFA